MSTDERRCKLYKYAVAMKTIGGLHTAYWIEFYYADDTEHATEQARDANPNAEILCAAYAER